MDTVKLWKSDNKDGWDVLFFVLFLAYGFWIFARDGFSLVNFWYTLFVGFLVVLTSRTFLKTLAKEKAVNKALFDSGYKTVLEMVTTVAGGSNKFKGLVRDMVVFSIDGETDKYSVGLSNTMNVTFYHFVFLGSDKKWVAVVDGNNIQYFSN